VIQRPVDRLEIGEDGGSKQGPGAAQAEVSIQRLPPDQLQQRTAAGVAAHQILLTLVVSRSHPTGTAAAAAMQAWGGGGAGGSNRQGGQRHSTESTRMYGLTLKCKFDPFCHAHGQPVTGTCTPSAMPLGQQLGAAMASA